MPKYQKALPLTCHNSHRNKQTAFKFHKHQLVTASTALPCPYINQPLLLSDIFFSSFFMTTNNTTTADIYLDPDFRFPSSSSHHHDHQQKPRRKKRTPKIDSNKPKNSGKKPDSSAPKITRPCTECGKKFWSWKALFGHMRCHPERQWRGINPPPNHRNPFFQQPSSPTTTPEDEEVASCLLMLAHSAASLEDEDCRFECSSCKKVFGSHQALGGHRASHKNVKGCFAITRSGEDGVGAEEGESMNTNSHKCRIGGYKRCHWEKGDVSSSFSTQTQCHHANSGLDLNLPAPPQDDSASSCSLDLRLGL